MKEVNYVIINTRNTLGRVGEGFDMKLTELAKKIRKRHVDEDCFGDGVQRNIVKSNIKVVFTDHEERHGFVLDFIKEAGIPVRVYDQDYKNDDWGDTYYSTWIETQ